MENVGFSLPAHHPGWDGMAGGNKCTPYLWWLAVLRELLKGDLSDCVHNAGSSMCVCVCGVGGGRVRTRV